MQVVVLCGGSGTRLKEMSEFVPKPLIPIGGTPMVVHIMRLYAYYGFKDFVLALGYKQDAFKQYFAHYDLINNDVTLNIGRYQGDNCQLHYVDQGWKVTLSDTGELNAKGSRLKQVEKYIQGDTFMVTYGDGIGDIDIPSLVAFHRSHGKMVTITGVHPSPKYGEIHHDKGRVISFVEKPVNDCMINGGFMVMNRKIFDYLIPDPQCDLERGTFELLAAKGEMMVYPHHGYWGAMDTLSEMHELDQLWRTGQAKWKVW
ncbi:glucose-1-phosphate cytidylyltransferase [bacterium]|nr:MAG: glucose-1-phosphate cytidylyltransferase [bacterium]